MEQQETDSSSAIGLVWRFASSIRHNITRQVRSTLSRRKVFLSQKSLEERELIFLTSMENSLSLRGNQGMPVQLPSSENVSKSEKGCPPLQTRSGSGLTLPC